MSDTAVLVGSDLMMASRLRSALGRLTQVDGSAEVPAARIVFVDLNQHIAERLALIRSLHAAGARVIGFCNHDDRATRIAGKDAGADEVVTNSHLPETAVRVMAAA